MIPSTPVVHHQIPNADQSSDLYVKFEYLMLSRSINAYQELRWLVEALFILRRSQSLQDNDAPRLASWRLSLRMPDNGGAESQNRLGGGSAG